MTHHIPHGINARPLVPASQQGKDQEILLPDGLESDSSESDREGEEEQDESDEEDQAAQLQLLNSQLSSQDTQEMESQDLSGWKTRQSPTDRDSDASDTESGSDAFDSESGSDAGSDTIRVDGPKRPSTPLFSPSAKRQKTPTETLSTSPISSRIVPQRSAAAKALEGLTLLKKQRELYEAEAASQRAEKIKAMQRPKTVSPPKQKRLTETQPRILERTFINPKHAEMDGKNTRLEKPVANATVNVIENASLSQNRNRAPTPASEEYVAESDSEEEPGSKTTSTPTARQLQQLAPRETSPNADEEESEDEDEEAPQVPPSPAPRRGGIPSSDEETSEDEDEEAPQVPPSPAPRRGGIPSSDEETSEDEDEEAPQVPPSPAPRRGGIPNSDEETSKDEDKEQSPHISPSLALRQGDVPDSDEEISEDEDEEQSPQISPSLTPRQGDVPNSDEEESEDDDEAPAKPPSPVKQRPGIFDVEEDESMNEQDESMNKEEAPPKLPSPVKQRPGIFDVEEDESMNEQDESMNKEEAPPKLPSPVKQRPGIFDVEEDESMNEQDESMNKEEAPPKLPSPVKQRPGIFDVEEDESMNEQDESMNKEEAPPKLPSPVKQRASIFDIEEDESMTEEEAPLKLPSPPKRRRGRPLKTPLKTPSTTKSKTTAVLPSVEPSFPTPAATASPHPASSRGTTYLSSNAVFRSPPAVPADPSSALKNRYSDEERKALDIYRDNFCAINKITHHTFNRLVQCSKHDFFSGTAKTNFWKGLKGVLPHRDTHSFQRFMRRTYHNLSIGKWTTEAEEELDALVKEHGKNWKIIAEIMDRTTDDIISRWRNHVKHRETQRAKTWKAKEVDALCNAIMRFLGTYRSYEGNLRTILLQQEKLDVVWGNISDMMFGIRSGQQCAAKWVQLQGRAKAIRHEADMESRLHERKRGSGRQHRIQEVTYVDMWANEYVEMDDPIEDDSGGEDEEAETVVAKINGKAKALDPTQDSQGTSGEDEDSGSASESESESESSEDEAPILSPTKGPARPIVLVPAPAPAEETTSSDGSSSEKGDSNYESSDED